MPKTNSIPVLAFEERLPVTEKKFDLAFSGTQIFDLTQSASDVLSAIIALEQMSNDVIEIDTKSNVSDIQRLEQKIDFVTELLAKVLLSQQHPVAKKDLRMNALEINWSPEISLQSGDYCIVSIYLSQKFPSPLELPILVVDSELTETISHQVVGKILLTDEKVIDDLTRMIFLFHRRQVARNRAQS